MTKQNLLYRLNSHNLPILCAALFVVTLICGIITYSISYKLSHLPQNYLHAQSLYQTSLNAQSALKQARLSENKQDLLPHLDRFETSMISLINDPVLSENMQQNQAIDGLAIDKKNLSAIIHDLKHYNDLKTRLRTYLYVVDNAHQEFAQKHNAETDRSYFDLVTNTAPDADVTEIVNEYVTPLISTSQLGNDVHLIVANLEKTDAAKQLSNVNILEKDVQNALKRINAAFSINNNDTNLSNLEDITFQIISFAYGPNNIFEIKRSILNLDNDIATSLHAYDQSFAQISAITDNLRRQYAASLYANIDNNATFLQIIFAINAILFATSLATLLIQFKKPADDSADHAQNSFAQGDSFAQGIHHIIHSTAAFWSVKTATIFGSLKKDISNKIEDTRRKKQVSPVITAPEFNLTDHLDNLDAADDKAGQRLNYQDILAKIDTKNTDDASHNNWKAAQPNLELMPDSEPSVIEPLKVKLENEGRIETYLEFEPDEISNEIDDSEKDMAGYIAKESAREAKSQPKSMTDMDLDMVSQRKHARMDMRQNQASENEMTDTPPLLLDTTMRVAAQRQRLKKALTGLDTAQRSEIYKSNTAQSMAKQALQTPHGKKNLEEIISMIKHDQGDPSKHMQTDLKPNQGQADIDDDLNDFDADFSNIHDNARRA